MTVTYLRKGRSVRATGEIIGDALAANAKKVKPARKDWSAIVVTADEIEAGQEKPPIRPREKKDKPQDAPKRPRKRKPAPLPQWKQLVENVRTLEIDHTPEGWPAVKMRLLSELADELEAAHAKLAEFLPITSNAKSAAAGSERNAHE